MGIETCLAGGRLSPCECAVDERPADGASAPADASDATPGPDVVPDETGQQLDGSFFDATNDVSHAADTGADAGFD
jgi:hypothetical protein